MGRDLWTAFYGCFYHLSSNPYIYIIINMIYYLYAIYLFIMAFLQGRFYKFLNKAEVLVSNPPPYTTTKPISQLP